MSTITNRACIRRKWTSLVQIIYHSSNLMFLDLYLTPGRRVLPYKRVWGCAAGWGPIITTGLTIMGRIFNRVTRMGWHILGFFG